MNGGSTHAFTLVHLSDLHLYLDPELASSDAGTRRAARRRLHRSVRRTKRAGRLFGVDNLEIHNPSALTALEEALAALADSVDSTGERSERPTLVVLHTGDVETVGPWEEPDGAVTFRGYDYLHNVVRDVVMKGVVWIDVFGNHDVWGGMWPFFERLKGQDRHTENFTNITQVAGLEDYRSSIQIPSGDGRLSLAVHRVNTVDPDFVAATFAWGRIGSHPMGEAPGAVCSALAEEVRGGGRPYLRIVAMHHPPHAFEDGWWFKRQLLTRAGTARLAGRESFAESVNGAVQLVLAGHRHKADPSPDSAMPHDQPPLLRGMTVQLVAPSPTATGHLSHFDQESDADRRAALDEMRMRSFPTYEIHFDESEEQSLRVWRANYRLQPDAGRDKRRAFNTHIFESGPRQLMLETRLQ